MVVKVKKKKGVRKKKLPRSKSVNQGLRRVRKVVAHGSRTRWKEERATSQTTTTTT